MANDTLDLTTLLTPQRDGASLAIVESNPASETPLAESVQANVNSRRKTPCVVHRRVATEDETGGSSTVWVQIGSFTVTVESNNVTTGIRPTTDVQPVTGSIAISPYNIYFPVEADVQPNDRIGVPAFFNVWRPNHAYTYNEKVIPTQVGGNGHYYRAAKSGTSGGSEPEMPTNRGGTIEDGSLIWKEVGPADFFEVIGSNRGLTEQEELVVAAKRLEF